MRSTTASADLSASTAVPFCPPHRQPLDRFAHAVLPHDVLRHPAEQRARQRQEVAAPAVEYSLGPDESIVPQVVPQLQLAGDALRRRGRGVDGGVDEPVVQRDEYDGQARCFSSGRGGFNSMTNSS